MNVFLDTIDNKKIVPNFLGIGAPKCGTTWLSEVLRKHPDVFMAHGKELVYFASNKKFSKGESWYLDHFSGVKGHAAVGEFSASYMGAREVAAERIQSFNPNIKLIVLLRDPVHRAYSHYRWLAQVGRNGSNSFIESLKNNSGIKRESLYYENLTHYWERFPPENLLILKYEELKKDGFAMQRRVFRFLGVDEEFDSGLVKTVIGKTISPRSRFLERRRIRAHVFARKNNLAFLITLFKQSGLSNLYRQWNNKKVRGITQEEYLAAATFFEDDVSRLAEFTGMDCSDWLVWDEG